MEWPFGVCDVLTMCPHVVQESLATDSIRIQSALQWLGERICGPECGKGQDAPTRAKRVHNKLCGRSTCVTIQLGIWFEPAVQCTTSTTRICICYLNGQSAGGIGRPLGPHPSCAACPHWENMFNIFYQH